MYNFGGALDKREGVLTVFEQIGFTEVTGTNGIEAAVLTSYALTLNALEQQYGAISASDKPAFTTGNGTAKAAVVFEDAHPEKQFMAINSDQMGTISANLRGQRASERDAWHAATDGRITRQAGYTVTHEYGHMLHNALAAKAGMRSTTFLAHAVPEIRELAETKYGATSRHSSGYSESSHSSAEYFAEAFASLHSGRPNAHGRALEEWLKGHKLR